MIEHGGDVVCEDPYSLQYVHDWFVTQELVKIWHDESNYYNDDELVDWCNGYEQSKAQSVQIKQDLMPIVWHPTKMQDWSMIEDGKKRIKVMLT